MNSAELGPVAYEGYCNAIVLITGAQLPAFEELLPALQLAWCAAGSEAALFTMEKIRQGTGTKAVGKTSESAQEPPQKP